MRYAGLKYNSIYVISDKPFVNNTFKVLEVPSELDHVSSVDLIANYKIRNNEFKYKLSKKPANQLKVALVGNWKMRCGIANYSENLWPPTIKFVKDFKLFIEKNDDSTGSVNVIGDQIISDEKISACWKRGESTLELINEIKKYDPDIIWIQHEFGLWPNARHWLAMMSQLSDFRIIITMHSVFHHRDKTVSEAAMPEIITHLQGGYDVLKNKKQIPGKVYVIPHGCFPCISKEKIWNCYKSKHTIIQFGFLFRYKGWQNVIEAVSILKSKYQDIFFTGLCSESPFNKSEHQIYYNELMELIEKLNLQENVGLIRGYQSDQSLDSYLRTNKVAIFPYISAPEHEVFGASGAARMAMSKGLPVITSNVNHFSDLNTIKADTPAQIAEELDKLFSNPILMKEQIDRQCIYLEENSWEKIALRYINIFENP